MSRRGRLSRITPNSSSGGKDFEDLVFEIFKNGLFEKGGYGPYKSNENNLIKNNPKHKSISQSDRFRDEPDITLKRNIKKKNSKIDTEKYKQSDYETHNPQIIIEVKFLLKDIKMEYLKQILEYQLNRFPSSYAFFVIPKNTNITKLMKIRLNDSGVGVLRFPHEKIMESQRNRLTEAITFVRGENYYTVDKEYSKDEIFNKMKWEVLPKLVLRTESKAILNDDIRNENVIMGYKKKLILASNINLKNWENLHDLEEIYPSKITEYYEEEFFKAVTDENVNEVQIGEPILTKFERARIVGARALQLSQGAPSLIIVDGSFDFRPIDMAKMELTARVLPLGIARKLPNNVSQIIPIQWLRDINSISDIYDIDHL